MSTFHQQSQAHEGEGTYEGCPCGWIMRARAPGGRAPQGAPLRLDNEGAHTLATHKARLARQDKEMCAQRSPQGGRGNPLRVGIIGCGTIGAVHAQAAAASDQIELVAVADVQRELAEKTAAAHTVETVYSSGAALLADARVEAVVLALPACFRIELGIQALRAGKHLLTEKPVARSADEVRRLISVQGDRVAACCSSRFQFLESTRTVTDWIGQGKLGALRLLRCRAISPAGPAPETPAPAWRLSRELNGGGILVNWGCYDLDYLLGISGWRLRPQTVLAQSWRVPSTFAETVAPAADAETHIAGLVRCADGIALTYERGEYTAAQAEASWEVIGEAGSLRLWMTPAQEKEILYFEGNRAKGTIPRTLWAGNESYNDIHRALLEDFATAVRTGCPPKTTLAQALLVQQITDALYRSAERGEAVEVK